MTFSGMIYVPPEFWEGLAAVLAMFAAGSILLQVTLEHFFQTGLFQVVNERPESTSEVRRYRLARKVFEKGVDLKPVLSVLISWAVVAQFDFDAYEAILDGTGSGFTLFLTAVAFSGGSTVMHRIYKAYSAIRVAESNLRVIKAEASTKEAKSDERISSARMRTEEARSDQRVSEMEGKT